MVPVATGIYGLESDPVRLPPPPPPLALITPPDIVMVVPSGFTIPNAEPVATGSKADVIVALGDVFKAVTTCVDVAIDGTPVEVVL